MTKEQRKSGLKIIDENESPDYPVPDDETELGTEADKPNSALNDLKLFVEDRIQEEEI